MADRGLLEFKVVVLGDKGVGKTCLVLRFIEGYFAPKQQSTIGAFFLTKKLVLPDQTQCKLQIWDTAGQERFRAMAPMYYRNAAAAVVCFDVTNEDSFTMMQDWVEELKQNVPEEKLVLAIASTKIDLPRTVTRERAERYAKKVKALFYETSAKDNLGVSELFSGMAQEVVRTRGSDLAAAGSSPGGGVRMATPAGRLSTAARSAGFQEMQKNESSSCCS